MRASERVYRTLREEIMHGVLPPGHLIAEVEQAERMGVSRTPVREAIGRLLADLLVEPNTGRGVVVAPISIDNVHDLFEMREALDTACAALAARRADPTVFHDLATRFEAAHQRLATGDAEVQHYYDLVSELDAAIDAATNNRYLQQAQASMHSQLIRVRRLSKTNTTRLMASAKEHEQIARAIAAGQPELARAATLVHLHNALAAIDEAAAEPHHEASTPSMSKEVS